MGKPYSQKFKGEGYCGGGRRFIGVFGGKEMLGECQHGDPVSEELACEGALPTGKTRCTGRIKTGRAPGMAVPADRKRKQ